MVEVWNMRNLKVNPGAPATACSAPATTKTGSRAYLGLARLVCRYTCREGHCPKFPSGAWINAVSRWTDVRDVFGIASDGKTVTTWSDPNAAVDAVTRTESLGELELAEDPGTPHLGRRPQDRLP